MSRETLLAIEELLGPPSENGESASAEIDADRANFKAKLWQVRDKIKDDRREEDRNTGETRKVNWQGILDLAESTLREPHKDMQVAAFLTEAMVVRHGLPGLRDALELLRRFVAERWDRLISPFEGDDPQAVAALEWLDDPEGGGRFPNRVRAMPLLKGRFSFLDWKPNERGQLPENRVEFEKAAAAATFEECDAVVTELAGCQNELQGLTDALVERLGREGAPAMTGLRNAIEDCLRLLQDIMKNKQPASAAGDHAANERGGGVAGASGTSFTTSREAIYQQLRLAADALQRLEPHSPVPYLVKRAVELGALPFHQMIRALIRDANVLDELSRELGIKEVDASQSSDE